jgi:hypothetical protein
VILPLQNCKRPAKPNKIEMIIYYDNVTVKEGKRNITYCMKGGKEILKGHNS